MIAPDSLKGSLRATEAAAIMGEAVGHEIPGTEIKEVPLSDGGEGFLEALLQAAGGREIAVDVHDPLMRPMRASFGMLPDGRTAVVEMAAAAGLELLAPGERNPWLTTSYGVGELIQAALDEGARHILLGVGGTATVDGGTGILQALGARFLDRRGNPLPAGGGALQHLEKIDLSALDPRLEESLITIACDVANPLTGPEGAAEVYAPQKGADEEMTRHLARNLVRLAEVVLRTTGREVATLPYGGAAGGTAAVLAGLIKARLQPGFDVVSEITRLEEHIRKSDIILTAEGHTDEQTLQGKLPYALARKASSFRIPVVLFTGGADTTLLERLLKIFLGVVPLNPSLMPYEEAMKNVRLHLRWAVRQTLRLLNDTSLLKEGEGYG